MGEPWEEAKLAPVVTPWVRKGKGAGGVSRAGPLPPHSPGGTLVLRSMFFYFLSLSCFLAERTVILLVVVVNVVVVVFF